MMKHLLLTTIAAVVLVGCGESKQSVSPAETQAAEPVAEATQPKPPTAEAPDISLFDAATKGNIEAIKQHLAAGTDVDAKTPFFHTPLHGAVLSGHKEIAELLITNSADVNAKGDRGVTPLDLAIKYKQTELTDLLQKHGGKTQKELNVLFDSIRTGNIEAVKKHIAAGMDVNAKSAHIRTIGVVTGNLTSTPLHGAAGWGQKEIAALLIAKGADVNSMGSVGTPLHVAVLGGYKEIVELLIDGGANVNANIASGNFEGETPLVFANGEIADLLRKHGGKTSEELKAEGK